ncbi:MAG: hypothetical protein BMS9Abin02_0958 [Anaerolineae bacterium]|nr:MAG: hypothetical protein BMS9Abin02_0958 [Anaerolineae bacterium]
MYRRIWLTWIGFIIILFLLSAVGSDLSAAWSLTEDDQHLVNSQIAAETVGPLEFSMSAFPEAVTPGQAFSLNLSVSTNSEFQVYPEITVGIPDTISVEMGAVPAGVIFDMQNRNISWQPIIDGQKKSSIISLQFTANVASIQEPVQEIVAQIKLGGDVQAASTSIWIGILPTVTISFDPPQVAVGQPVQARAQVLGPGPITQEWDLGDGRVVEALDPVIIFPTAGTYEVTLNASNPLGLSTAQAIVSIIPQPIARFKPADQTIAVGQEIAFLNESGGEPLLTYTWDFNDGFGSQEREPTHKFNQPGTYLIHLVVQNEYGLSEAFAEVMVSAPPIADAIIPPKGTAGQFVNLAAFTDDSVTEVSWDMGDGQTIHGLEPRYVYWAAGDYQVEMTVKNDFGTTTVSQLINIEPGNLFLYMPLTLSNTGSVNVDGPGPVDAEELPLVESESLLVESSGIIAQLEALEFPDTAGPADKLLAYINLARSVNNMRPLRYVHELSVAAQRHTDDMANNSFVGHSGSDDSTPALRIWEAGYPGGYGGEATAWGMEDPIAPVEFWLNSPGHRAILLHPAVSDVGIGYTLNYDSPNIWYWTAEFGSLSLPQIVIQPTPVPQPDVPSEDTTGQPAVDLTIQLLGPPKQSNFDLYPDNVLYFTWSMKQPLDEGQFFNLILGPEGTEGTSQGSANVPASGSQYQLVIGAANIVSEVGNNFWKIQLIDGSGQILSESEKWPILLNRRGSEDIEPTATPTPTVSPTEAPETAPSPTSLPLSTPLPSPTP